jgi:putative intracellular protease/amidase
MRAVAFFQPGWADWEAGQVLPLLREQLGCEIRVATPDGSAQTSIGGVRALADDAFADIGPRDAEIYLAIGSDRWIQFRDEVFYGLLREALASGAIVGVICAATVAAARAGLFEGRAHTSNGRGWLAEMAPGYAGAERYIDTPRAVRDGGLVSAAGLAPASFAVEVMQLVAPEKQTAIDEYRSLMSLEWADSQS